MKFHRTLIVALSLVTSITYSMNDPIDTDDYNTLKNAIGRRNGMIYAAAFEVCHPTPSDHSIEDLAVEIDFFGPWAEDPIAGTAIIHGTKYPLTGHIAYVIKQWFDNFYGN